MMSLSKRRTVSIWIALSALLPAMVAIVAFVVWLGARWHWPLSRRQWPPSPLDETWVWTTAFLSALALALISRWLTPEPWEGRRDALNSPIDDETHIVLLDSDGAVARPHASN